jgi:hypothetical protein
MAKSNRKSSTSIWPEGWEAKWEFFSRRNLFVVLSSVSALALSACGGGSSTNQPPVDDLPVFTSPASVSVTENAPATTVIYQAAASNSGGKPIAYALAGGVDQARFSLSPTGELRFVASPDFELATDADQNNVYDVEIVATAGAKEARLVLHVSVVNDKENAALSYLCSGVGCAAPKKQVASLAFSGELRGDPHGWPLLVGEEDGTLQDVYGIPVFTPPPAHRRIAEVSTVGERGLIAMVQAPNTFISLDFYVMYADVHDIVIERFPGVWEKGADIDTNSEPRKVMLRIPHAQYDNDVGGWMGYGPDGNLYIATGDGGGSGDPLNTAQDPNSLLGKVLRVSADFSTITPIAMGFKNPNNGTFYNGMLVIADQGENSREEINLVPLTGPVRNYGWPYKEGTMTVRPGGTSEMVDPIIECPHKAGSRGCFHIVGGYIYNGPWTALKEQFVFGERAYADPAGIKRDGFIFSVPAASLVFGGPTIQANAFYDRTADIFAGYTGSAIDPRAVTSRLLLYNGGADDAGQILSIGGS